MDRAEFSCARCAEQARRGVDLKIEMSGKAGSCEGPRVYEAYKRHPSGGLRWEGCPRSAVSPRTEAFLAHYDRAEGRLSATEQRLAPWALLDAYGEIGFVAGLRRWQEIEDAKAEQRRKG